LGQTSLQHALISVIVSVRDKALKIAAKKENTQGQLQPECLSRHDVPLQ
jgi:hypothetical protein